MTIFMMVMMIKVRTPYANRTVHSNELTGRVAKAAKPSGKQSVVPLKHIGKGNNYPCT